MCSKDLYPQNMFWLRNKKIISCYALLTIYDNAVQLASLTSEDFSFGRYLFVLFQEKNLLCNLQMAADKMVTTSAL